MNDHRRPLYAILLIAAALRLTLLSNAVLWYDESGSVWMATLPFARMIAATAGDVHPPLYFALLWAWVRLFGTSEISVRLPSLIFSLVAVWLTWQLGERLSLGRSAVIIGASLMAFMPSQIYYAQEARMYALLCVEFLVALLAALDIRWWLGLALIALYWTHNYGLVLAVPINAMALCVLWFKKANALRWQALTGWLIANVIAAGSWFPWLTVLAVQTRDISAGNWWLPPLVASAPIEIVNKVAWGVIIPSWLGSHTLLLVIGALTFAIVRAVVRFNWPAFLLVGIIAMPIAIATGISLLWHNILLYRGLTPLAPILFLLISWAFAELKPRAQLMVALFTAPIIAAAVIVYYDKVDDQKGHVNDWVIPIADDWQAGDVVYHSNEGSVMTMHFYTPDIWPQYTMPAHWRNLGALSATTKDAMGFEFYDLNAVEWHRAWFMVGSGPTIAQAEDDAVADLLARYPHRLVRQETYPLSHFALYLLYNPATGVP